MDLNHPISSQLERLHAVLPGIADRAAALDAAPGLLPTTDVDMLATSGLLLAPFPPELGGSGWMGAGAFEVLRLLGRASLPLGRIYEGHVNAVRLVLRHANAAQIRAAADDARGGCLFGVWNTESHTVSLHLREGTLNGGKLLCSGAGLVERALVTARCDVPHRHGQQMVLVPLQRGTRRADLTPWTPTGMRASATGSVDFDGMEVAPDQLIGTADAYQTQPDFSTGAWRFLAVQLGGLEAIAEAMRAHLARTQRGGDPHQAARLGSAVAAAETARLWVSSAAIMVEENAVDPDRMIAYVNLARGVVERSALDVMEAASRSVGLQGFVAPNHLERLVRDLSTYLRQPGPDHALVSGAAAALRAPAPVGDIWR